MYGLTIYTQAYNLLCNVHGNSEHRVVARDDSTVTNVLQTQQFLVTSGMQTATMTATAAAVESQPCMHVLINLAMSGWNLESAMLSSTTAYAVYVTYPDASNRGRQVDFETFRVWRNLTKQWIAFYVANIILN